MPEEKEGKDRISPCGSSRLEYENTDPGVCHALHSEIVLPLTIAYILEIQETNLEDHMYKMKQSTIVKYIYKIQGKHTKHIKK